MALYPKELLFASESVTEGHPDKVCDQISDAILDECLRRDPASRVACDVYVAMGTVVVGGEVTSRAEFNLDGVVRDVGHDVGYDSPGFGFDVNACTITRSTHQQSPDIRMALSRSPLGPGNQGVASGYACNQTPEFMPMPVVLANRLAMRLADARKREVLSYLGPDGKIQVTVEYRGGKPVHVDSVAVAAQHTRQVVTRDGQWMTDDARQEIVARVVTPILQPLMDRKTKVLVNAAGRFLVGGPQAHSGSTGRKSGCDTYGGWAPHGGGTFSGKDPGNVDRSASYMARCVAKNIVAAGLAERVEVQLGYAIGIAEPVSVHVDTQGTSLLSDDLISEAVRKTFDLRPRGIVSSLKLLRPIYRETARHGHFGRDLPTFSWEKTDRAGALRRAAGLAAA